MEQRNLVGSGGRRSGVALSRGVARPVARLGADVVKEQRVGVFVDVANMYYSARGLYGTKVNFNELLKEAVRGRKLVRAIAYAVRAGEKDEDAFYKALESFAYEVRLKDLQVFFDGSKKADWDIGIAMDAVEMAPKLDTVVLVSGDGDFVPMVEHLRRALGCRVEVMAFGRSASAKLVEAANRFADMDGNKGLLLPKKV